MNTLIILTEKAIAKGDLLRIFTESKQYGDHEIVESDECILIGNQEKYCRINLSPQDMVDDELSGFDDEEIESIPFRAHLTNLDFDEEGSAKRIIRTLLKHYPEMWVDNDKDFLGSAEEYLKS